MIVDFHFILDPIRCVMMQDLAPLAPSNKRKELLKERDLKHIFPWSNSDWRMMMEFSGRERCQPNVCLKDISTRWCPWSYYNQSEEDRQILSDRVLFIWDAQIRLCKLNLKIQGHLLPLQRWQSTCGGSMFCLIDMIGHLDLVIWCKGVS